MIFDFKHFSLNEEHQYMEIVFSIDNIHYYPLIYLKESKNPFIISFNGVTNYRVNHNYLFLSIIKNKNSQKKVESIIKDHLHFFKQLHQDIITADNNIKYILKNTLINNFYENFLELKDNKNICVQLNNLTQQFLIEYKKFHIIATTEWNFLYNHDEKNALMVLSFFSNEIKNCQFFIEENTSINALFYSLLKKFDIDFFHDSFQIIYKVANFSSETFFYSIDSYIDYHLKNQTKDFSIFFFNLMDKLYIYKDFKDLFSEKFIAYYNDDLFTLSQSIYQHILFEFYTIEFIESIISNQQKNIDFKPEFLKKIFYLIYQLLFNNNFNDAYYIFSLLNDYYQTLVLESFNSYSGVPYSSINAMIEYNQQKKHLENF